MIKGKNFIVFSDDWGRHPFSCQHIMQSFLPHNRLLWVNTIGMRTPTLSVYDMQRALGKIRSWLQPTKNTAQNQELPPNLRIISPFMIPYNTYGAVRTFNAKNVVKAVNEAAQAWGFTDPIVLTTQPLSVDYMGKLHEALTVYYCVDDFIHWPGMNQPELVQGMENSLVAQADLIFAVSESLCTSRQNGKDPTRLLTHGVDLAHFAKAAQEQERPAELAHISQPIIGFYGLIDGRFDIALVEDILKNKPHWQIVCIGTKLIPLDILEKYPNFHSIDAISYELLPSYASCFDVAFIPYHINAQTEAINPLKLREYIATGKPIVTTPMREAARFEKAIHIAERGPAFIQALEGALQEKKNPSLRAQYLQGESWQDKAALVATWIEEALQKKEKSHV